MTGPGEVRTLPPASAMEARPSATPMMLLQIAMDQGADLDRLERLMNMQEQWEAREARKAFAVALAAFKANPPRLHKNKTVDFQTPKGRTTYRHATLDEVALQIGAALSPHGLSFRWNVEQVEARRVRVTCTLGHVMGHAEQVVMEGAPDDSGNKNSIQQVGSTVTYLQRYTLLAITGMAVKDQDDDGAGATLHRDEVQQAVQAIEQARTVQDLQTAFLEASRKFKSNKVALGAVIAAKDSRKAELGGAQ